MATNAAAIAMAMMNGEGGGSGGDVTKQYVDDHLALKADKIETAEYPISDSVTGINPSITDSANGFVQDVKVYGESRTSKNLISGYTVNTAIDGNGAATTNTGALISNKIDVKAGVSYVLSGSKQTSMIVAHGYDSNNTYLSYIQIATGSAFVPSDNLPGVTQIIIQWNQSGKGSILPVNGQFEAGTEPTEYEPYGIISIGEDGELEITTTDGTASSTATVTTGIPLYGIPVTTGETYTDGDGVKWLADTADVEVVVKRCGVVDLGDLTWTKRLGYFMTEDLNGLIQKTSSNNEVPSLISDIYAPYGWEGASPDMTIIVKPIIYPSTTYAGDVLITNNSYTDADEFKTAMSGHKLVYELATPTTQELTTAEKSALLALRTFDNVTNVTITDDPFVNISYIKNTDNGKAAEQLADNLRASIGWIFAVPEMHRNILRGKYLGSSVTAAQLAAIADGSFDDLYVGDYWEIPVTIDGTTVSNKWRIADFDYFLHNGTDKHHAVIVPDNTLYTAQMGGNTSYGYYQSDMFTTNLNKGRTAIADAFPDMVISYEYYDIIGSTVTKYDCTAELMALSSLTGVYSDYIHTNYLPVLLQMSLFRIMPDFIGANPNGSGHDAGFLTQTVKTSSFYWAISTRMKMMEMRTSDSYGVRPFFLLGDAGT